MNTRSYLRRWLLTEAIRALAVGFTLIIFVLAVVPMFFGIYVMLFHHG